MSASMDPGARRPASARRYLCARRKHRPNAGPALFDLLPDELVVRVAEASASIGDVVRLGRTCRRLTAICRDDNLWCSLYSACHGIPIVRAPSALGKDWRWLCRVRSSPGIPAAAGGGWTFWGEQEGGRANGVGIGMRTVTPTTTPSTGSEVSGGDGTDVALTEAYEGDWVSGKRCGHGLWTLCETRTGRVTDLYDGQWEDDVFDGNGAYISIDGDWLYEGSWHANQKHCYGVETTRDGVGLEGSIHKGEWKDDKPHGRGVYISDGWRCEGVWQRGHMHGFGTSVNAMGDIYCGEWKDDVPEGVGTYTSHKGWRIEGSWINSLAHSNVIVTYDDGSRWAGIVERRVCTDGIAEAHAADAHIVSHGKGDGAVGCTCRTCRAPMRFSLTHENNQ
ncbi:F-box domain containing protein [Pandoravirus neocaledonia]|uniref:F-box domain containing protein n=1 Tax=Pandoravirus neocaledonia TaxID=2107708 RepID=A0A2U7UCB2_9VIRU|nr:F-box domain containing protein [Pandoravirus neocaledonia]AVK76084.1 F-box domain containing protein [Pandoravirus neocaledonia]